MDNIETDPEKALVFLQSMMKGIVVVSLKNNNAFFMKRGNLYLIHKLDFSESGKINKVFHKKDYHISYFIEKFGNEDWFITDMNLETYIDWWRTHDGTRQTEV